MALADGPALKATKAESAPITAVHRTKSEDFSSRESVKEVHRLVSQVVSALNDPVFEQHASLSLRMARAHALTLLDHLEKMVDSR
jgi:hypothetical protein